MNRYILAICSLLILLCSCSDEMKGWEETKEGAIVFHDADSFFGGTYTWSGDTLVFGVANGKGEFAFSDKLNGDNDFKKKTTFYCGSPEKPDNLQDYVVGKLNKKGKVDGFGAHVRDDKIYLGEFNNGKLDGEGAIYINSALNYIGKLKDNEPNGEGELYFDNSNVLKYKGKFKNGNYNGKGVLYDSIGNKIYEGKFSQGLFDGYGVAYDSLGNATKHVWTKGGVSETAQLLYDNLKNHQSQYPPKEQEEISNRILRWERYYIWMYIGWGLFALVFLLLCIGASQEEDVNSRYDRSKPWNKYVVWLDWLFFGWCGAHRYVLKSMFGLIYPILIVSLIIANIRELSIYFFYPSTWALWTTGTFTHVCITAMATLLLIDFFWIPWRCYVLNHKYFRHDKNESMILKGEVTPIMSFGYSVAPTTKIEATNISNVLRELKTIHAREFQGKKGFLTRIGRAFSGNDPWLDFEKKRARDIQVQAKKAEIAQNNYAEMCEKLNVMLAESRANAYRNFVLAKELIKKALAAKGKKQELVNDISLDTEKLSVTTSLEAISNIQAGIDWSSTTTSAIECSKQLLATGMKGPWAIGIGVGASLLGAALDSINAAQNACEEANKQCAEAISQLGTICDKVTTSQATILRSGEMIIALNKANEAFWHAYTDLRNRVFTENPSFSQFIRGVKVCEEDSNDSEFRNSVMHLAQVCSEYNKINKAKL